MSRDVSWGLYIAQFTFLVGVAASAVMLVYPTLIDISTLFSFPDGLKSWGLGGI